MIRTSSSVVAILLVLSVISSSAVPLVHAKEPQLVTEGLYYLDSTTDAHSEFALVITRDGGAISPKPNDPGAPTLQGLHVDGTHYPFVARRVNMKHISFRTAAVRGVCFRFAGRIDFEQVGPIEHVPFVVGILTTICHGKTYQRKVRFVHAVVL